jgi:hypothetical protein
MAERSDAIFSLFGYTPATLAAQRKQQEEQIQQSTEESARRGEVAGIQKDIQGYASLFGFETPAMKQAKANEAITKSFLLEQDPEARMNIVRTATEQSPELGIQLRQIMLQEAAASRAADLQEREMRVKELEAQAKGKGTPAVVGLLGKKERTAYENIMSNDPTVKAELETIDTSSAWNPFSDAPTEGSVQEVLMNRAQELRANNKGMGAPTALRTAIQEYKGMTGTPAAATATSPAAPVMDLSTVSK